MTFIAYMVFVLACATIFHLCTRAGDHHNVGLMLAIYGALIAIVIPAIYEVFCWLFNHIDIVLKFGG